MPLSFADSRDQILAELDQAVRYLVEGEMETARHLLTNAKSIFVVGTGRSALALKMAAMRWMHLGLVVHVVGETTTPAIVKGDLLVAASGSGKTSTAVHAVEVAKSVGAEVLVLTADRTSTMAAEATAVVLVRAAGKQEKDSAASHQYAGSLFEQCVLLCLDMLFQQMWKASGLDRDQLWANHANLE